MRHKLAIVAAVCGTILVADQATKYLAVSRLTLALETRHGFVDRLGGFYTLKHMGSEPPAVVIHGFWDNRYVENPGAAWGLLSRVGDSWRVPFFHLISLLAIGIIVAFLRRLEADQRLMTVALAVVLGGALGNYLDRLTRGYVIDFIDWHVKDSHWPTFNLADSAICVGVVLMLLETLTAPRREPPPVKNPDSLAAP